MSLEILEKVKEFLIKLVKNEDFRTRLMSDKISEVRKVIQDSGYSFSKEEFETATIQILELKELGEFHELTEEELLGAVGGWMRRFPKEPIFQPMYGVIIEPPDDYYPQPEPIPEPQPMYGIVIEPIDVQPLYGVVIEPELY
uniref:Nif11-type n=1 Tax=[Tolypothrix] sp. PCC 7415 TaxID=373957 RepID=A0A2P0ZG99_9CYAN|nr:Nif11-type precursor [[Tolypothrix] sp. PCC 7415]